MGMCKAMEEFKKKIQVETGIKAFRIVWGNDDKKIVEAVCKMLEVAPEYVRSIMNSSTTDADTVRT